MNLMQQSIARFARATAEAYRRKAERGYEPGGELRKVADSLDAIDWTVQGEQRPLTKDVPALRHLPQAVAEVRDGDGPAREPMQACIGYAPWQTFYAPSAWSEPFVDEIACAALVGPDGLVRSDEVALGFFLLGPRTLYREHAHSLHEIYFVLGGKGEWGFDTRNNRRTFAVGDVVYTAPDQRHDIATGDVPLLAAYTWTQDPAAPSYHRANGPWADGEIVHPPMAGGG